MKVEIFKSESSDDLERMINLFLEKLEKAFTHIEIKFITQSSSEYQNVISIWYQ